MRKEIIAIAGIAFGVSTIRASLKLLTSSSNAKTVGTTKTANFDAEESDDLFDNTESLFDGDDNLF